MCETPTGTTQRVGTRWKSVACTTEVIIVHAPQKAADLRCGGHPMIPYDQVAASAPSPSAAAGNQVGKRYTDSSSGLVVLVTKSGGGTLAVGDVALEPVAPKLLPSSD